MSSSRNGSRGTSQRQGTSQPNTRNGQGQTNDPPVWKKRVWTGSGHLEVAVWSRMIGEGDAEREVMNTTIRKTYKEGEEYKESKSLRQEELTIAAALLNEAFTWITDQDQRE